MSEARFLGIDFSGAADPWKPNCRNPTVWIAVLEGFRLSDLVPVQSLPGDGPPFERLVALLAEGRFRAAAIDAPFGVPAAHTPGGSHRRLLEEVGAMAPAPDRPFPTGEALYRLAQSVAPFDPNRKQLRETERDCGARARSTLWHGKDADGRTGRPGTPFTIACLFLLARSGRPLWPWRDEAGMLVEAFPAAQLKAWGLPAAGYGPPDRSEASPATIAARRALRRDMLKAVMAHTRFEVSREHARLMQDSADALDAFIAAFAGRAAANRQLRFAPSAAWRIEGAIAVHD
jgi:hypothetical protein